jgi:hypothetical protein
LARSAINALKRPTAFGEKSAILSTYFLLVVEQLQEVGAFRFCLFKGGL